MEITRFTAWSVLLPNVEGAYRMAGDRISYGMDAVVVRLTTDDGSQGIGESGTVGVTFDAQNLPGQIAGVTALAPTVLGADARNPQALQRRMNAAMTGHPYCKSPIDIAAWDLAARLEGVPLWKRLGGDGGFAEGGIVRRHVAPAEEFLAFAGDDALDFALCGGGGIFV